MSDATTPADPTDQIATVAATPAVAPWREDLDGIYFLLDDPARDGWQQRSRLAAYIERLEAKRDALLAEHEAWDEWGNHSGDALAKEVLLGIAVEAHDNAERVIRGE